MFQAGLQQRLSDQEETYLKLKSELLRDGFIQENLRVEKVIHGLYVFIVGTSS